MKNSASSVKRPKPLALGFSGSPGSGASGGRNLEKRMQRTAGQIAKASSTFGIKQANAITKLLQDGDVDGSISAFQKTAYSSIINLISIAEEEYRKGRREHQAYVLNSLISTGRELAADVAASAAKRDLSNILVREVLEPMFRMLLQDVMAEQVKIKAILSDKVPEKHVDGVVREMDDSLKRLAEKMTVHLRNTAAAMSEHVS